MAVARRLGRSLQRAAPDLVGMVPVNILEMWPFSRSEAGALVDEDVILKLSAVWRSVSIIANTCAMMPLHTFAKLLTGRRPIALPGEQYIWGRPNPEVNRFVFWATVFFHLALTGNAYCLVAWTEDPLTLRRTAVELWPIEPKRVQVGRDPKTRRKVYLIDGVTAEVDWLAGGSIVHFQGLGGDGLKGLSPIQMGSMSLGKALAVSKWAAHYYANSSAPGGYLSTEQNLSPTQAEQISAEWEKRHKGVANVNKMAVLGHGTKWMSTTMNPEDAMLVASEQLGYIEVANWFGVPAFMVGAVDKQSSWGTGVAEQFQGLLSYTLDPYLVNVELTISDELLAPQNHYAKFGRGGLLRMNPEKLGEVVERMFRNSAINADDWRELLEMEPLPDGLGQKYWIMSNMATADVLAQGGDVANPPKLQPATKD